MGLPTVRTNIIRRKILQSLALGMTETGAAASAGIARNSLLNWKNDDPDFLSDVRAAQAEAAERYLKTVDGAAKDCPKWASYLLERHPLAKDQFGAQTTSQTTVAVQLNISRGDEDRG